VPFGISPGEEDVSLAELPRWAGHGDVTSKAMMKRLIRISGFAAQDAPGEAEDSVTDGGSVKECALGVVATGSLSHQHVRHGYISG
jgi:hypothetical protein